MKSILLLSTLCFVSILHCQKTQEFTFKFNVKKWKITNQKLQSIDKNKISTISLFDVLGHPIRFNVVKKSFSEQPIEHLEVFKGKSDDDKKLISLTITKKSMSGSYLENGIQYFIEPVKNKCKMYKVYIRSKDSSKIETGQVKDFIE